MKSPFKKSNTLLLLFPPLYSFTETLEQTPCYQFHKCDKNLAISLYVEYMHSQLFFFETSNITLFIHMHTSTTSVVSLLRRIV